ncbi:hypothetical protein N7478_011942 [Penicillium angulare]|uniref:uncharacterized protein n=1 Tax=Penicillium angulare TaxID=116970 RepID=UPI002541B229|nr:uncharacterized protein N7478_011942 [Penicillium angulare]KAJ5261347.1 hypothetical protein N7478_011942 [Penicillium angulare]
MPIAVVLGSTGSQGKGVIDALLKDPKWTLRGICRNRNSATALELSEKGVEMVDGDVGDEEFLLKAFTGADAIFAITAYWHLLGPRDIDQAGEEEFRQLQSIAIAASKTETLNHFVLSTIPSAELMSNGEHPVPHFDYKNKAVQWMKVHTNKLYEITTYVYVALYPNNFVNEAFMRFVKVRPGGYFLLLPASPTAVMPFSGEITHNIGVVVDAILAAPEKTIGRTVPLHTDHATFTEVVALFEKVTGQTAVYSEVSDESFEHLYGPLFGRELVLGLRFHEKYPSEDLNDLPPLGTGTLMTLEELGVGDRVIGLEGAMKGFGDKLL